MVTGPGRAFVRRSRADQDAGALINAGDVSSDRDGSRDGGPISWLGQGEGRIVNGANDFPRLAGPRANVHEVDHGRGPGSSRGTDSAARQGRWRFR